jgi:hypothetical protein
VTGGGLAGELLESKETATEETATEVNTAVDEREELDSGSSQLRPLSAEEEAQLEAEAVAEMLALETGGDTLLLQDEAAAAAAAAAPADTEQDDLLQVAASPWHTAEPQLQSPSEEHGAWSVTPDHSRDSLGHGLGEVLSLKQELEDERAAAAVRIQAVQRGRVVRSGEVDVSAGSAPTQVPMGQSEQHLDGTLDYNTWLDEVVETILTEVSVVVSGPKCVMIALTMRLNG